MKKPILIVALIFVAGVAAYFFSLFPKPQDKIPQRIFDVSDYESAAGDIGAQINDLSPTPPTGEAWIVSEAEFVKGKPYVYVTYHDTHNIFRILLEIFFIQSSGRDGYSFRTIAVFEPLDTGLPTGQASWKLTAGQDLPDAGETVKINPN